jgi:hypothetical protein
LTRKLILDGRTRILKENASTSGYLPERVRFPPPSLTLSFLFQTPITARPAGSLTLFTRLASI